jgi:hypothetical protein
VSGASDQPADIIEGADAIQTDAYGANLDFLATCLSCTSAQAGPNSSGAEAQDRVAGENISEGRVPANGRSSGSLFTLPANPFLRLAIAGWDGVTRADRRSSRAHVQGALVDLTPGDGEVAALRLGESRGDAMYTRDYRHADSESNAARVALEGEPGAVVVLHSGGTSEGQGRACIASVYGTEVLPSDRGPAGSQITVPLVATMALLHGDATGARVGSVSDGKSQRMAGIGTTWVGRSSADPQPLR